MWIIRLCENGSPLHNDMKDRSIFFHQIKIAQQYQIASPQMDSLTDHFGREIKQKLLQISIRSGAMNTSYDNSVMAKQVAHEKCANFLLDIKCVTASENNSIVNEE